MVDPDTIIEWGLDYLTRLPEDIPTKRKKSRISDKQVNFGITKCNKSQKRVYQSGPPKQKIKEEVVDSIIKQRFGDSYSKKDMILLFDVMADKINPPKLPKRTCKKCELFKYLVDNLALLYEFIAFEKFE